MRTLLKPACVAFTVLFLLSSLTASEAGEKKIKVLIVTGFDVGSHKWKESTEVVRKILDKSERFDVTVSKDTTVFASPTLSDYGVLVLNYGFWKQADPSKKAKEGFLSYVKNGGSVVALHFACSSFQDWDEYGVMLGRVWKKGVGGHGPYGPFTVNIKNSKHPITKGMEDFKIEDELYAKLSGDEKIEVLATAYSEWSKKTEPIVFVKRYGKGRVVQNVLGHGLISKKNDMYQALVRRCAEWAATGKVTTN